MAIILELVLAPDPSNQSTNEYKKNAYRYVCALLNSGGGELRLKTTLTRDQIIRPIEQNAEKYLSTDVTKYLSVRSTEQEHVMSIKGHQTLCTMRYNAYLPTETQAFQIKSTDVEEMRKILYENRIVDVSDIIQKGPARFVLNHYIGFHESKTVQFKLLSNKFPKESADETSTKNTPNKKCTKHHVNKKSTENFAEQLNSNQLTNYVSAFANRCGGRIYCGVRNDAIVKGQIVEEDKNEVISRIDGYIKAMIWPEEIGEPTRGAEGQWDISFERVVDAQGKEIQSTYVVILTINNCPGGVFTKPPESYHVVNEEVKKMEFGEWKKRIQHGMCKGMSLCKWSSEKLRYKCDLLDGKLLRMINDGDCDGFMKLAKESDLETLEIRMVVSSKWCTYYYRRDQFQEAEYHLKAVEVLLSKANDSSIFDAKRALVLSSLLRSKGNHKESLQVAKELLAKIEQITPCLLTAAFYIQFATMLARNAKQLHIKLPPGRSYKDEITSFYNKAIQQLNEISYLPESQLDRLQKAYIHIALHKLDWSPSDVVVEQMVPLEDIHESDTCLTRVKELNTSEHSINGFRKCQFLIAQAFLNYRQSQHKNSKKERDELLEKAIKTVKKAKMLAERNKFKELSGYARRDEVMFQNESCTYLQARKRPRIA